MNLKILSDDKLIEKTVFHVREERELLAKILHCFMEIQRRRLFADYRYSSLHDMAVRHFDYSSDQACRRISAMQLLRELPEVESKIVNGELNLTKLGAAQTLFNQEAKLDAVLEREVKLEILNEISSKSTRDAEKILMKHSSAPETLRPDLIRVLSEDSVELRFPANQELVGKIEQLKGLLAHSHSGISLGELFDTLCDFGLEKWRVGESKHKLSASKIGENEKAGNSYAEVSRAENSISMGGGSDAQTSASSGKNKDSDLSKAQNTRSSKLRPALRTSVKRQIFEKANHQCENCGSRNALQVEHVLPFARGGSDEIENLKVLCRNCNLRAAIQAFGQMTMDHFLKH